MEIRGVSCCGSPQDSLVSYSFVGVLNTQAPVSDSSNRQRRPDIVGTRSRQGQVIPKVFLWSDELDLAATNYSIDLSPDRASWLP